MAVWESLLLNLAEIFRPDLWRDFEVGSRRTIKRRRFRTFIYVCVFLLASFAKRVLV
jgi:hypothetical protein